MEKLIDETILDGIVVSKNRDLEEVRAGKNKRNENEDGDENEAGSRALGKKRLQRVRQCLQSLPRLPLPRSLSSLAFLSSLWLVGLKLSVLFSLSGKCESDKVLARAPPSG